MATSAWHRLAEELGIPIKKIGDNPHAGGKRPQTAAAPLVTPPNSPKSQAQRQFQQNLGQED